MNALPSGTVTLVLGDVEASTERWEASADNMRAAMNTLSAAVDQLVAAHDGARPLEQGEGDSFVAAFGRAADAVAFADALQAATPLPVRIGIHTGDVEVVDIGYAGPTIIRAARLRDAGHGGQVLLSQTTAALVVDHVMLDDLGEHKLKGLSRPERIYQLPGEFPGLRLAEENAPVPPRLTTFIGREVEMTQVRDLIKEPGCVTLTGAGGAGKTRIALELVSERGSHAGAPSWFVDLAAVDRDTGVDAAVADAVSAHSTPGRPPADSIAAIVRDRDALLVFDNCEHVLGAASALAADLLGRCANLTVLATSREPLGLAGEVTYRVPSMAEAEAMAMFVELARRADPRFTVDAATAPVIKEICERLDGMPLAIELAAARMRVFSATQLLDVLHDRFRLLTGGARTALPRQRTLEASVDWSYALLLDAERTLLRRLSVFAGGFTIDAAVAVAADGALEPHHVFDLLVQLVDKSLVTNDDRATDRFRMLETIRHYAAARLVDSGEAEACRRRHFDFFVSVVRRGQSGAGGEREQLALIRREEANLRRAVQWAIDQPGPDALAAIALPLAHYWRHGRRVREAAAMIEVLEERTRESPPALRARIVSMAASLPVHNAQDAGRAREALALAREAGDDRLLMRTVLDVHGVIANVEQDEPELLDEALTIARALGDERSLAMALALRGFHIMREEGSFQRGAPLLREALSLSRKHGMARLEGSVMAWLCMGGCMVETVPLEDFERAAALLEEVGNGFILANLYAIAAAMRAIAGDDEGCDRDLAALDLLALEMDDLGGAVNQLLGHGMVALLRGDAPKAIENLQLFAGGKGSFAASIIAQLAVAEAIAGRLDDAEAHAAAADAVGGDSSGILRTGVALARTEVACRRGDHTAAFELALAAATSPDVTRSVMTGLLVALIGREALHLGRAEECARVAGAADAAGVAFGMAEIGLSRTLLGDTLTECRAAVGDEKFDTLWNEGFGLTVDEALGLLQRGRGSRQRPMLGWDSLTPTEADVARLVAAGASNKDVADQLFMSVATVKTHLTRIYDKVGVKTRAQLAAASHSSRIGDA